VCNSKLVLRSASSIVPRQLDWLWLEVFPKGQLSLVLGHGGQGKSLQTVDLAAAITSGGTLPGHTSPCEKGSCIFLALEDDPSDTFRPRLEAAGADLNKVILVEGVMTKGTGHCTRLFSLETDISELEAKIVETGDVKLVVIDPVNSYFGSNKNSYSDVEVRQVLTPVVEMARRCGVAVVGVMHLNKGSGSAITRGVGSVAFCAIARSVWLVARDPSDRSVHHMVNVKTNTAKSGIGFSFKIDQRVCVSLGTNQPVIEWLPGNCELSADELLQAMDIPAPRLPKKVVAKEIITGALSDGPVPVKDVRQLCKNADISDSTIDRAIDDLGVKSGKSSFDGPWVLSMPSPSND
jgi:putative DNA primase/helicase